MPSIISNIVSSIRKAAVELSLIPYKVFRLSANRAIRELCEKIPSRGSSNGFVVCEAFWDNPHHWVRLALFAPALAKNLGSNLLGLYEKSTSSAILSSLKSLPLSDTVCIDDMPNEQHLLAAKQMLKSVTCSEDIINLSFPFGYPGHMFYDGVLKSELIGNIDLDCPNLEKYLAKTLSYLEQYSALVTSRYISSVIVSHPVHFRFSTLAHISLSHGIPVYVLNYLNEHITIRKLVNPAELKRGSYEWPDYARVEKLPLKIRANLTTIGKEYLNLIRSGNKSEGASIGVYDGAEVDSQNKVLLLNKLGLVDGKPTVVIFTNCWPDFPNIYFPGWYVDYVDWFKKTISIILDIPEKNWIIKQHPAEFMYGSKTKITDMLPSPLPRHIKLWPEWASGNLVASVADAIITASGTAGVEYPALGKPVIIARETAYAHWGFCNLASTYDRYVELLRGDTATIPPTLWQRELAQLYLAVTLCCAPQMGSSYRFSWGILSYRLWPKISRFITENHAYLQQERRFMENWIRSDCDSYNFYKSINYDAWNNCLVKKS